MQTRISIVEGDITAQRVEDITTDSSPLAYLLVFFFDDLRFGFPAFFARTDPGRMSDRGLELALRMRAVGFGAAITALAAASRAIGTR